jgi:chaperonin GroEL (HSP60 family)
LVELRAAHEKSGGQSMGVEVYTGDIVDMYEKNVIDSTKVKQQAIKTATELASMVLRIDDVIAASKPREEAPMGPEEEEY